jgi:hypothetical protein
MSIIIVNESWSENCAIYNFTFHYGNGDYYSGYVYDNPNKYQTGNNIMIVDENGLNGYYNITSKNDSTAIKKMVIPPVVYCG